MNNNTRIIVLNLILVVLSYNALYSEISRTNINVFQQASFTEFAGDVEDAPLGNLSKNSIADYCLEIAEEFGSGACDPDDYTNIFKNPHGIILAPSNDDPTEDFKFLVTTEPSGFLVYMDAHPDHLRSHDGHTYAHVDLAKIDIGNFTNFQNIVSDFNGNFWIVDRGNNRILRLSHNWSSGEHHFSIAGEIYFDESELFDVYFSNSKSTILEDHKLYIVTRSPSQVLAVWPYFSGDNLESEYTQKRDLNEVLANKIIDPHSIFGAYNNEIGSTGKSNELYIVHKNNQLVCVKDYGSNATLIRRTVLSSNFKSRFSTIRTNIDGEVYVVDAGNSTIHKYDARFRHLYTTGQYGIPGESSELSFFNLKNIAIRGKEVFTVETYSQSSGISRYFNKSKVIQHRFKNLSDFGYNPEKAAENSQLANIRFKLSDRGNTSLNLFKASDLETSIWTKDLGSLTSGWHETVIDWDGNFEGSQVDENVIFILATQRFFADGDDALTKEIVIDLEPPQVGTAGTIVYEEFPSEINPVRFEVPFDEPATGILSLRKEGGEEIVALGSGSEHAEVLTFNWPIPEGELLSCEVIEAYIEAKDIAGNETDEIQLSGPSGVLGRTIFNSTGSISQLTPSINRHEISPISTIFENTFATISATVDNTCSVPFRYNIAIFDNSEMTGNPVFSLAPEGTEMPEGVDGFSFDWNGTDQEGEFLSDGQYYVLTTIHSASGEVITSRDISFDNVITLNTFVPSISLIGEGSNEIIDKDGVIHLSKVGANSIHVTPGYSPSVPATGNIVIEYTNASASGAHVQIRETHPITQSPIEIFTTPTEELLGGIYTFDIYYENALGNSGKSDVSKVTTSINQNGQLISTILVDHSVPVALVDVNDNILLESRDVMGTVFNSSPGFSQLTFEYTYSVSLEAPGGTQVTIVDNESFPSGQFKASFTIPSANITDDGTYKITASITNDLGSESEPATAFFYKNFRPNVVGVNLASTPISGKSYITGTLGDPNISTTGPDKNFEKYVLLYKPGLDQDPGADLSLPVLEANGWTSTTGAEADERLFAPIFRQPDDASFPYSNTSTQPTNLRGLATVGYINAEALSIGDYTLLALSYEKNNPLPLGSTENFSVDAESGPGIAIENIMTEETSEALEIDYTLSVAGHVQVVITEVDQSSGAHIRKVNSFQYADQSANTLHTVSWKYNDLFGNFVPDGTYKVIISAEEVSGTSADWAELDPVPVNTDLQISNVVVSSDFIVVPPRDGEEFEGENVVNVSFNANKYCFATLEIFYNGTLCKTVGPVEFTSEGKSTPRTLSWDGTGDGSLPYDNVTPYEIKLSVSSIENPADETVTAEGLFVKRISPEIIEDVPGVPGLTLTLENPDLQYDADNDNTTAGTSEFYWENSLNGFSLSPTPQTATGRLFVSGQQDVEVWKSEETSSDLRVSIQKDLIDLKVHYRYSYKGPFGVILVEGVAEFAPTYKIDCLGGSVVGSDNPVSYTDIKVENISSGVTPNDLAGLYDIEWFYFEGPTPPDPVDNPCGSGHTSGDYMANIDFYLVYKGENTIHKPIVNSPVIKIDHYNPITKTEPFAGDFPDVAYLSNPEIIYSYKVVAVPEAGKVTFPQLSNFAKVGGDPSITPQGEIVEPGVVISLRDNKRGYDVTKDGVVIGEFNSVPSAVENKERFNIFVDGSSEATGTKRLHWPFPASGIPNIPGYNEIAFFTSNNLDPRDPINGYVNIIGMYKTSDPSITLTAENKIDYSFQLDLAPDDTYPKVLNVNPDIFDPSDPLYAGPGTAGLLPSTLVFERPAGGEGETFSDLGFSVSLTGNTYTIDRDLTLLPRDPWNSSLDPNLISATNGLLGERTVFAHNGFLLNSSPISIPLAYQTIVQLPNNAGSLANASTYPFTFWSDASGNVIPNEALSGATPQDPPVYGDVQLYYADGVVNEDLEIETFDPTSGSFSVEHTALATPRRIVEIKGVAELDGTSVTDYTLDYYSPVSGAWNEFGAIVKTLANPLPKKISEPDNVIGFWDVTQCNGPYILKLSYTLDGGIETAYQTINVGTYVDAELEGQYVYSPYSKVSILFPEGSSHKGPVSIVPIDKEEIRNVDIGQNGILPVGPLAEISPSGLVFEEPKPLIGFTLTKRDVEAMGIPLDRLGNINVYFVDEDKRELAVLETGVTRYIIREGSQNVKEPVGATNVALEEGDVLTIESTIDHTSIYGFFDDISDFSLDALPNLIRQTTVSLSGRNVHSGQVSVYTSTDSILDRSSSHTDVTVDGDGNWSLSSVTLAEGVNYVFAVSTSGTDERVLQKRVVVDTKSPVISGVIEKQFVSQTSVNNPGFVVNADEDGKILVSNVSNPNDILKEFGLTKVPGGFSATVDLVAESFDDPRSIIAIRAEDEAGNVSEPVYVEVLLDNSPPVIFLNETNIYKGVSGSIVDNFAVDRVEFQLSVSGISISDVIALGGQQSETFTYTPDLTGIPEGEGTLRITAYDKAGNVTHLANPINISVVRSVQIDLNTTVAGAPSGDINDFPVLVRLNESNFNFDFVGADPAAIRFVDEHDNLLFFEIDSWDYENRVATFWVNVNILGNSINSIWMIWNDPQAPGGSNGAEVFHADNGFAAVYHLNEMGNSDADGYKDATANALHGTGINLGEENDVLGMIGFGQSFNGYNQYIKLSGTASGPLNFPEDGQYTVSAWAYLDRKENVSRPIVTKGIYQYGLRMRHDHKWEFFESKASNYKDRTIFPAEKREWVYLTGVRDGSKQYLYMNGVVVDSTIYSDNVGTRDESYDVRIAHNKPWWKFFKGKLDEVRFSNVARSPEWIKLNYANQRLHQSLVVVGPEDYTQWAHNKTLTVNTKKTGADIQGDIKNFPVLIRLDASNFDFSKALPQGQDLRVTGSGGFPLEFEIDSWDAAGEKAAVWVILPEVDGKSRTDLVLYWGNQEASSKSRSLSVFHPVDNFAGVWHLGNQTDQGSYADATGFWHGTAVDLLPDADVSGITGQATDFDGALSHIKIPQSASGELNLPKYDIYTLSAWAKTKDLYGEDQPILSKGEHQYAIKKKPDGKWEYYHKSHEAWEVVRHPAQEYKWTLVTGVQDGGKMRLYINGTKVDDTIELVCQGCSGRNEGNNVNIGRNSQIPGRFFNGLIDEVRISTQARSSDWIRLNYQNQKADQNVVVESDKLQPGRYQVKAVHSNKCLDVYSYSTDNGANIQQYGCHDGPNQKFDVSYLGEGLYKLKAVHSGKAMKVYNHSTENEANIVQWSYQGWDSQKFYLLYLGNDTYAIEAKHSGKVVDVYGQSTADEANVIQWEYMGQGNQQWRFLPVE